MSIQNLEWKLYPKRFARDRFREGKRLDSNRSISESRSFEFDSARPSDVLLTLRQGSTLLSSTGSVVLSKENNEKRRIHISVEMTSLCRIPRQRGLLLAKKWKHQIQTLFDQDEIIPSNAFDIPNTSSHFETKLNVEILDADGNGFDAAFLSCISLLQRLRLPAVEIESDGHVSIAEDMGNGMEIPFRCLPFPLTFGCIEEILVVDPIENEIIVMDALLTLVLDMSGNVLLCDATGNLPIPILHSALFHAQDAAKCSPLLQNPFKTAPP